MSVTPGKLKAVIIGVGHRSMYFASYAQSHPDQLEIVGAADPNSQRLQQAQKVFSIPHDRCYESAEALADAPKFADFAINGTMDHQHVLTSLPLLNSGYHLLLEKPFAINEQELWQLVDLAREKDRKVVICHVLRHTPFYASIREKVLNGEIGDIINVQAVEHVSYHHMAVGYIRGKWRKKSTTGSSMLLAKSCHDLDIISWMKSGIKPLRVASFGSNFQFKQDKAPHNAGNRCIPNE